MKRLLAALALFLTLAVVLVSAALAWLWWDASRIKDDYFDARKGAIADRSVSRARVQTGAVDELVVLTSDTGLDIRFRVLRPEHADDRFPVLVVLGGHRTGSDAVELFGDPGQFAIVAMDYPYDGPEKLRGLLQILRHLPRVRRALLDIPPAVSLALDWLHEQSWADENRIVMAGVSLGVPFAATAAARDTRLDALWLVHGAADNHAWLETNIARRVENKALHRPLATALLWVANGPSFNTAKRVARLSPRPVMIVGARDDERMPAGQTEALFAAAGEPKSLRWTAGMHIEPGRSDVVEALLLIARSELARSDRAAAEQPSAGTE